MDCHKLTHSTSINLSSTALGIGDTVVNTTSSLSEYLGLGFYFSILCVLLGKLFPQKDSEMNFYIISIVYVLS